MIGLVWFVVISVVVITVWRFGVHDSRNRKEK